MNGKLLLIIFFLKIAGRVLGTNNSYVILAPKIFRPGMKAKINVLILKEQPPGTPVDVEATFLINSIPIASAAGQFRAGTLGSLQLSIPFEGFPRDSNRYNIRKQLRVTGTGGLTFNTTQTNGVFFNTKGFSIYVQTDKGVYKPSQTVHMRILAVYPSLQIHKSKMTIGITDEKNNKLASWKDLITPSGVVTRDFELSSQPNLGTWKITVEVDGRREVKTFDVREYVLPKFKVDVLTNSYAALGNGEIRGFVSAKYTYGKGVKGLAKVWLQFQCAFQSKCDTHPHREFQLDENHSFSIPEKEVKNMYYKHCGYNNAYKWTQFATVNVSVTEDLTGKTYFGTTKVAIRKTDVVLTFPEANPKSFKPSVPFQILLRATRPDNTPLVNQTVRVQILESLAGFRSPDEDGNWTSYYTDENGYLSFNLKVSNDINSVNIFAETVGKNGEKGTSRKYLRRFKSPSRTFLQLKTERYAVQAGEDIIFNMTTTEAISTLNYLVLSKGNIIHSSFLSYSSNVTSATLKIASTRNMSPSVNIVVYFVRADGEIIADSLKVTVNGAFENMVSVKFSSEQTKPGEAVNVNVVASPFSQVGLLAVDKSVLLLDQGNDFSVSQVMQELESYNRNYGGFSSFVRGRRKRSFRFFPWYPSGTNVKQIFQNAGVLVLTDSLKFRTKPNRGSSSRFRFFQKSGARGGRLKSTRNRPSKLAHVTKVRSFFPETWLWEDVETNSSGHAQVQSVSPDTITSWVLSGFAVSNETGFGVANEKPQ
ncbi:CD109 antigen-like, partial [Paramuricea clavata]